MQIQKIIERRAQLDCKSDIENSQLWGEEEIQYGTNEIYEKILYTLNNAMRVKFSDLSSETIQNTINDDKQMMELIAIWKDTYRLEKLMYITFLTH
jgi:hypothetical protein